MTSKQKCWRFFQDGVWITRYCYIYVATILVIMSETAGLSSSARNRPSKQQYRCNICNKSFDSAEMLESHKRFEHSEPGKSKPPAGVG